MKTARCLLLAAVSFAGITFVLPVSQLEAQEPAETQQELQKLRDWLQRLEQEIQTLKTNKPQAVPADKKQQRVVTLLETPYLGRYYIGRGDNSYARYFAAKLSFVNLTPKPVVIPREGIQLLADGTAKSIGKVSNRIRNESFQVGAENFRLRNLNPAKKVRLAPGGIGSTWVFFDGLEDGTHVPELKLVLKFADGNTELDINAVEKASLGLTIERIGPRGSLGLLTVGGTLNTINLGSLMDDLDQLAGQKVVRIVLRWADGSVAPDQRLRNWIQQNAQATNREELGNQQYPQVPAAIREFHLCKLPKVNNSNHRHSIQSHTSAASTGNIPRIHDSEAEAVQAALASAFQSLPRDELLQSIEEGHLFSRAAALATGGGRLSEEHLSVVLEYADHKEPLLQKAALTALRHFGDQTAVEKLTAYAKKNTEPLADTAIASLAGSRYASAHKALLTILENEPPASKKRLVQVLAKYPRPVWSDAIYRFVKDPREGLNLEALQALTLVGHPQLVDVLRDALNGSDETLRIKAFTILSTRTDRESEKIALDYTLKHLSDDPLDPKILNAMLNLLNRVKEKQAIPLLLAIFPKQENKHAIINTLSVIGDQGVADFFVKNFSKLPPQEKSTVLKALHTLHSPKFRELATSSLLSDNHSLVQAAAQGLQQDGSPEAIKILIEALEKGGNAATWSAVSNMLSQLATPEARAALREARNSSNSQKQRYAGNALQQIYQRSPAVQYIRKAGEAAKKKQFDKAIEYFTTAINIDPQIPYAYVGRANVYLRQEKFAESIPDFKKGWELDPWNAEALTGLCVVMVVHEGKHVEAIAKLENSRKKFGKQYLFAYNGACVYARAIELLKKQKQSADRDATIKKYTAKALSELESSVKRGFEDLKWMREDPDLKSLHELPEFKKISQTKPKTDQP